MKRYYIQLKKGGKNSLLYIIKDHVKVNNELAKKLIEQGSVWVNKVRTKDINFVVTDQLITVYYPEKPVNEYTLDEKNIIYEDDYFIIAYKEPGLNTCQTPMSDLDCMTHGILKYYMSKKIKYEPSAINRLDMPAQGLLFFAKSKSMETALHNLFKQRNVRKLYTAVTPKFELEKNEFLIKDTLEWKGKYQEAASYIKFIKEENNYFYFTVYPLTGRTHQIRKHFANYLKPIWGDCLYGKYKTSDEMKLFCWYYKFRHPVTGEIKEVMHLDKNRICMKD